MINCVVDSKKFGMLIKSALAFNLEAPLQIMKNNISIMCVDSSNVVMTNSFVDTINCDGELTVGIDLRKYSQIMSSVAESETTLQISPASTVISNGRVIFTIPNVVDARMMKERKIPNIPYKVKLKMQYGLFKEGLDALVASAADTQSSVTFTWDGNVVIFEGHSDSRVIVKYRESEFEVVEKSEGAFGTTVSLDYIKEISKSVKEFGEVSIGLGSDIPMFIGGKNGSYGAAYIVAPRIDRD